MKAKKLVLCILLSVALTVTFIPVMSFAQDEETAHQKAGEAVQVEDTVEAADVVDDVDDSQEPTVEAKDSSKVITNISLTIQAPVCGTFIQDNSNAQGPQPVVTIPSSCDYELSSYSDGSTSAWWYSYTDRSYEFTVKGGNTYTAELYLHTKDDLTEVASEPTFNIPGGKVSYFEVFPYDPDDGCTYFEVDVDFTAVHNYSHVIYGTGYLTNGVECDKCIGCGAEVNGRVAGGWSTRYVKSAKVKKGKKSLTVKWKKQSKKNLKKFDGYEIRYSTSNDINTAKAISVSKKAKSKKIGKLAKKTKYYVWISSYKNVNGVRNYSSWKWGTVKTK